MSIIGFGVFRAARAGSRPRPSAVSRHGGLRRDVRVISADLQTHVKRLAAGFVSALDSALKTAP